VLRDCALVLHAGDVGSPEALAELQGCRPVLAVRGNVDRGLWAADLPDSRLEEIDGTHVYLLHDLGTLDLDPVAAGVQVVVFGHSHRPSVTVRGGVLYVNPGSAGPRRFHDPVTMARLRLGPGRPEAEIIDLLHQPRE
jgi:putative phosphoesterase